MGLRYRSWESRRRELKSLSHRLEAGALTSASEDPRGSGVAGAPHAHEGSGGPDGLGGALRVRILFCKSEGRH